MHQFARRGRRLTALAVLVGAAVVASSGVGPVTAQAQPAHDRSSSAATKSLAGKTWRHRAQVDGRGGRDRVTITALRGFKVRSGMGTGRIRMRVDFASGRFAEVTEFISYHSVRKPWTPWLGASNLDRRGGKEIVLGFSTGAHTQLFHAYTYRPDGELLLFRAPRRSDSWMVNSSYGTGTSGWKCTRRGVQSRTVSPSGGRTVKVINTTYRVTRTGAWRRTYLTVAKVPTDAQGNPPAYIGNYATFTCPGLPKRVL